MLNEMSPNLRGVLGLVVFLALLGLLLAANNNWFAVPAELLGLATTVVNGVAMAALGWALVAFGRADTSLAKPKPPPSDSDKPSTGTTATSMLILPMLIVGLASCTMEQARDAGRTAWRFVETAAHAYEAGQIAVLGSCKMARELAVELKDEKRRDAITAGCDTAFELLKSAKEAIDTADKLLGAAR